MSTIHYANNTCADIRMFEPVFAEVYVTGVLDEDYAELFTIEILKGFNADGTDRMIISAA